MGRSLRIQASNTFYHIHNRGVAKQPIFLNDTDRKIFLSLLGETAALFQLEVYAYCLMENHYHLFLRTFQPNLSKALWHFTHQYSRSFNFRHERIGPVFQGRFRSHIVDVDSYATTLLRYIHLNPVEANMVESPEDYLWSSYPAYLGRMPVHTWLNQEWALNLFDSAQDKEARLKKFTLFHGQRCQA